MRTQSPATPSSLPRVGEEPKPRFRPGPSLESVLNGHGVLELGHSGPGVRELQELLNAEMQAAGNPTRLTVDGKFGAGTAAAVEWFQHHHAEAHPDAASALRPDAIAGPKTLRALKADVAAGASPQSLPKSEDTVSRAPATADKTAASGVEPSGGVSRAQPAVPQRSEPSSVASGPVDLVRRGRVDAALAEAARDLAAIAHAGEQAPGARVAEQMAGACWRDLERELTRLAAAEGQSVEAFVAEQHRRLGGRLAAVKAGLGDAAARGRYAELERAFFSKLGSLGRTTDVGAPKPAAPPKRAISGMLTATPPDLSALALADDGVLDAEVTLKPGDYGKVKVRSGTHAKLHLVLKDGAIDFAHSGVRFDPSLDAPMWFELKGIYGTEGEKGAQIRGDLRGLFAFDPNLTKTILGVDALPTKLDAVVALLQGRASHLKGAGDIASKVDIGSLRFNGDLSLAPGGKLDLGDKSEIVFGGTPGHQTHLRVTGDSHETTLWSEALAAKRVALGEGSSHLEATDLRGQLVVRIGTRFVPGSLVPQTEVRSALFSVERADIAGATLGEAGSEEHIELGRGKLRGAQILFDPKDAASPDRATHVAVWGRYAGDIAGLSHNVHAARTDALLNTHGSYSGMLGYDSAVGMSLSGVAKVEGTLQGVRAQILSNDDGSPKLAVESQGTQSFSADGYLEIGGGRIQLGKAGEHAGHFTLHSTGSATELKLPDGTIEKLPRMDLELEALTVAPNQPLAFSLDGAHLSVDAGEATLRHGLSMLQRTRGVEMSGTRLRIALDAGQVRLNGDQLVLRDSRLTTDLSIEHASGKLTPTLAGVTAKQEVLPPNLREVLRNEFEIASGKVGGVAAYVDALGSLGHLQQVELAGSMPLKVGTEIAPGIRVAEPPLANKLLGRFGIESKFKPEARVTFKVDGRRVVGGEIRFVPPLSYRVAHIDVPVHSLALVPDPKDPSKLKVDVDLAGVFTLGEHYANGKANAELQKRLGAGGVPSDIDAFMGAVGKLLQQVPTTGATGGLDRIRGAGDIAFEVKNAALQGQQTVTLKGIAAGSAKARLGAYVEPQHFDNFVQANPALDRALAKAIGEEKLGLTELARARGISLEQLYQTTPALASLDLVRLGVPLVTVPSVLSFGNGNEIDIISATRVTFKDGRFRAAVQARSVRVNNEHGTLLRGGYGEVELDLKLMPPAAGASPQSHQVAYTIRAPMIQLDGMAIGAERGNNIEFGGGLAQNLVITGSSRFERTPNGVRVLDPSLRVEGELRAPIHAGIDLINAGRTTHVGLERAHFAGHFLFEQGSASKTTQLSELQQAFTALAKREGIAPGLWKRAMAPVPEVPSYLTGDAKAAAALDVRRRLYGNITDLRERLPELFGDGKASERRQAERILDGMVTALIPTTMSVQGSLSDIAIDGGPFVVGGSGAANGGFSLEASSVRLRAEAKPLGTRELGVIEQVCATLRATRQGRDVGGALGHLLAMTPQERRGLAAAGAERAELYESIAHDMATMPPELRAVVQDKLLPALMPPVAEVEYSESGGLAVRGGVDVEMHTDDGGLGKGGTGPSSLDLGQGDLRLHVAEFRVGGPNGKVVLDTQPDASHGGLSGELSTEVDGGHLELASGGRLELAGGKLVAKLTDFDIVEGGAWPRVDAELVVEAEVAAKDLGKVAEHGEVVRHGSLGGRVRLRVGRLRLEPDGSYRVDDLNANVRIDLKQLETSLSRLKPLMQQAGADATSR